MGKLTRMIYKSGLELTGNVAGRACLLRRESTGCNQRCACQFSTEQRYQGFGDCVPDLFFGSGMLCHDGITIDLN